MEPFAFALPFQISYVVGSATQVQMCFTVTAGDANNNPVIFEATLIWDAALAAADNFASAKAAIVSQCASQFGLKVQSNNVNILMAVN